MFAGAVLGRLIKAKSFMRNSFTTSDLHNKKCDTIKDPDVL